MSFRALGALDDVDPPSSNVYLLLFILAGYAGPSGQAIASQETLAKRCKLSVRCVRDNLKLAEEAGLLKMDERRRRDGSRASNTIQLTFYDPEVAPEKLTRARPRRASREGSEVEADLLDVVDQPAMVAGSQPANGDTHNRQPLPGAPATIAGLATLEPVSLEPVERSNDLSQGACAGEPRSRTEDYDYIWGLYPKSGRKLTDDGAARRAVAVAVGEVGLARLAAAVRAFADDPDLARRDYGACSLQRWLGERRYRAFLASADAPPEPASARPVAGLPAPPAELRAAFGAAFGAAFEGSYFPAGVTPGGALVCRTRFARDQLLKRCAAWFADRSLTVIAEPDLAVAPVQECAS